MVKTVQVDEDLYKRFVEAVGNAHFGQPYGCIAGECRNALENHIKKMEAQKK